MGWFNDWFGTQYYKLLYEKRDNVEAHKFLDRLMNYLPVHPGDEIVDVGCGEGRHSLYLSEKGFNVIGLDLTKESIDIASKFSSNHLKFIQHDMRKPFPVQNANIALNLFTSFGYFLTRVENVEVLKNIYNALSKNGMLVLDFFNAWLVEKKLVREEKVTHGNINFTIKRYIEDNKVVKQISVEDDGHIQHYYERVELLKLEDFASLFNDTGFEITQCFGNYELEDFDRETSDRLILIASKKYASY